MVFNAQKNARKSVKCVLNRHKQQNLDLNFILKYCYESA